MGTGSSACAKTFPARQRISFSFLARATVSSHSTHRAAGTTTTGFTFRYNVVGIRMRLSYLARTFSSVSREVRNSCPPTLMCTTDGTWSKIVKSSSTMIPELPINHTSATESPTSLQAQQVCKTTDWTALRLWTDSDSFVHM